MSASSWDLKSEHLQLDHRHLLGGLSLLPSAPPPHGPRAIFLQHKSQHSSLLLQVLSGFPQTKRADRVRTPPQASTAPPSRPSWRAGAASGAQCSCYQASERAVPSAWNIPPVSQSNLFLWFAPALFLSL